MTTFGTYLHPQTCQSSKDVDPDLFVGYSFPHYHRVQQELAQALSYPSLPLRKAAYEEYGRAHTQEYLEKLALMAAD